MPGRAVSVSGTALDADGAPASGATVSLGQTVDGGGSSMSWTLGNTKGAPDGAWTIRNVPPGEYALQVLPDRATTLFNRARVPVRVHGSDVTGLLVTPDVPVPISGTVVTDDGEPLPKSPSLRVVPDLLGPGHRATFVVSGNNAGAIGPGGRFTYDTALPGPALLRVSGLPPGWGVKSVVLFGRDHTEVPFEIRAGQPIAGAQIVVTSRLPSITGTMVDEAGTPAHGAALLFPVDSARWHETAGTMRHARPDQYGRFRFDTVRPGEYLAIALDSLQTWQATDPEFLEGLRKRATQVTIEAGDNEPLTLRVQR